MPVIFWERNRQCRGLHDCVWLLENEGIKGKGKVEGVLRKRKRVGSCIASTQGCQK